MSQPLQSRSVRQGQRPAKTTRFVKTPKGYALIALIILAIVSVIVKKDMKSFDTVLVSTATGFVVDLIVGVFYKRKRFVSDGGIITGLIVGVIMGSFNPWYITAATTAIALASKHVLRIKRKPIFNPAAVGLLISTYAFGSMQSWWGGMSLLSTPYLVLLVVAGVIVTWRVKKFPQVLSFLVAYFLTCAVFTMIPSTHMEASYGFQNPMINSALFLAFFMITDPPTSPAKTSHQIWFGAVVGVVSVAIYLIDPAELSYLLIALLAANILKVFQTRLAVVGAHSKRRPTAMASKKSV